MTERDDSQYMQPAPSHPGAAADPATVQPDGVVSPGWQQLVHAHADTHRVWAERMAAHHRAFLEARARGMAHLLGASASAAAPHTHQAPARLAAPEAPRYSRAQIDAFYARDFAACFGPGFELLATHSRPPGLTAAITPRLDEIRLLEPSGGTHGRGALRARGRPIAGASRAELVDGIGQAMLFLAIALGHTLDRDGFEIETRFDLNDDDAAMSSPAGEIVYDVIVREIGDEADRAIVADVACLVDGGVVLRGSAVQRLVQAWPIAHRQDLLAAANFARPSARIGDLTLDYRSILSSALGKPSDAFGPMYTHLDHTQRVPRLPNPPFLFITRVVELEGTMGVAEPGVAVTVEYDIPRDAWYFEASGNRRLPFVVLLEAALQPCGWLAGYAGCPLASSDDLRFRNLDGVGAVVHAEIPPDAGVLRTRAVLTRVAKSAGMYILGFDIVCTIEEREIYRLHSVFGFFPREALLQQAGLPTTADDIAWRDRPSDFLVDLRAPVSRYFGRPLGLAGPMLLMLDRVTGYWPDAGRAGLGRMRAEKDVDPSEWFFKAHFYQDPVQPGSLGLESMLQLLQLYMLERDLARDIPNARFETIALDEAHSWKYRGQVLPTSKRVTTEIEITRIDRDARGVTVVADASLWVDGKRTYEAKSIGMRARAVEASEQDELVFDPTRDLWIADHCPTYSVPSLAMMNLIDVIGRAASARAGGRHVAAVEDLVLHRWAIADRAVRVRARVEPQDDDTLRVMLEIWREAARADLSRFEELGQATVRLATEYAPSPDALPPLQHAVQEESPYTSGHMFHGPAYQRQLDWLLGERGSTTTLDAAPTNIPVGVLHPALLDATTHGIPHDRLERWAEEIEPGQFSFPSRVEWMRFYSAPPTSGPVQCDVRFDGFDDGNTRFPVFRIQARQGDRVWVDYRIITVMFPQGPLVPREARDRFRFFSGRVAMPELHLSTHEGEATRLTPDAYGASNWLPGTLAAVYGLETKQPLEEIAVKEHVVRAAACHPSRVHFHPEQGEATCEAWPLSRIPVTVRREADRSIVVTSDAPSYVDLEPAVPLLERLTGPTDPAMRRLYAAMARAFVSRVVLRDVEAMERLRGRGVLYLGNHQSQIESILFATLMTAIQGVPVVVLANAKHENRWVGKLLRATHPDPTAVGADLVRYFDQSDPLSLPKIIEGLRDDLAANRRSFMVHVEGTRQRGAHDEITKISSVFTDLAVAASIPVVPIRFANGLPVEPLASGKLEFPVGYGGQEYRLGSPIEAAELSSLPLAERRRRVLAALGGLSESAEREGPGPANALLVERVERLMSEGRDEVSAMLLALVDQDPAVAALLQSWNFDPGMNP